MMGASTEGRGGRLYWALRHVREWCLGYLGRHAFLFIAAVSLVALGCLLMRPLIHPAIILMRTRVFLLAIGLPTFFVWWYLIRRGSILRRCLIAGLTAVLTVPIVQWGDELHEYASLARRYHSLNIVDLTVQPITGHERIHPRNAIHSLAYEVMGEVENPTVPNYVRLDQSGYYWTMAIEPATPITRTFRGIDELISVSGTDATPNLLLTKSRIKVHFECTESGHFSRNIDSAVVKTFSPWRFLHYQPQGVTYLKDDRGRWVQVVKLVRWTGILFPKPEFGGVQIITEGHETIGGWMERVFLGVGTWVPPEAIRNYPWLTGQNLVPYEVTRYMADSFRFQRGLLAPLPGYHDGDIRIPDQPEDLNPQPFAIYVEALPGEPGQFVHSFSLEPYGPERQGTNTMLYTPGDGHPVVYAYRFQDRGESFPGVSTVATKVMESKKAYTWGSHLPVEHRLFTRRIRGEVKSFWLTTLVTRKVGAQGEVPGEPLRFIAGGNPEVAITPPGINRVVWVDAFHPGGWVKQIEKELGPYWDGHMDADAAATTAE